MRYIREDLSPPVCLITIAGEEEGTGFVVGKLKDPASSSYHHFLLTNSHLDLKDAIDRQKPCQAHFGFKELLKPPAVSVNIVLVVLAECPELDYIFLRLESSPELDKYLSSSVHLGSLITADRPRPNDALVIVGHPGCKQRKVDPAVICKPNPPGKDSRFIHYQCCSFRGSSGSPCFSVPQQKLYCMHTGGTFPGPVRHIGLCSEVEYGVHLLEVIDDIRRQVMETSQNIHITADQLCLLFPQIKRN